MLAKFISIQIVSLDDTNRKWRIYSNYHYFNNMNENVYFVS